MSSVRSNTTLLMLIMLFFTSIKAQEIKWYSMDAGGGRSAAAGIELSGVAGQMDIARMTHNNTSLSGGYLPLPVDDDLIFIDSFE